MVGAAPPGRYAAGWWIRRLVGAAPPGGCCAARWVLRPALLVTPIATHKRHSHSSHAGCLTAWLPGYLAHCIATWSCSLVSPLEVSDTRHHTPVLPCMVCYLYCRSNPHKIDLVNSLWLLDSLVEGRYLPTGKQPAVLG